MSERDVAARVAVGIAGFCACLDLYPTQPMLPLFEQLFHVSKAATSLTVSATTLMVALLAPFAGALADRFGRRRIIVVSTLGLTIPTALAATSTGLHALIAWRFAQGIFIPGVLSVAIAYISDEWQEGGVGAAMAALVTGNVIGGFSGRLVSGIVTHLAGWRYSFLALGLINLAGGLVTWRYLPPDHHYKVHAARATGAARMALKTIIARITSGRLLVSYLVGFNVLFSLVATFTYVTFRLAAPPFSLDQFELSAVFAVYLVGAVATPIAGRWIDRAGPRAMLLAALSSAIFGAFLTLATQLSIVVIGLAFCAASAFICQSSSTSYLRVVAPLDARGAASGLYISIYYIGGSVGGVLPAAAWGWGGWPACVALVVAVQFITLAIATSLRHEAPEHHQVDAAEGAAVA
ncbi:MAG: MFS transporter [Gemmatimonadota bacterium]|nr:MFS transporter [Gemmatimonadota bacterium]